MLHDAYGWWTREAATLDVPTRPLEEDSTADVLVVGGGYLGMWTAWHLKDREPGLDVVLVDADRCGYGPSGRNGGFVSGYWDKLPAMVEKFGTGAALALAGAAGEAVHAIGAWAAAQDADIWFRAAPQIEIATTPTQDGAWAEPVEACRRLGPPGEYGALTPDGVARHARSPVFRGGAALKTSATVQPARLAFALKHRLIERGVRVHDHTRVVRIEDGGAVRATLGTGGSVTAGRAVLAVNHATGRLRPFTRMVSTASSHIVLTAPVPEALAEIGWTGGEGLCDSRTMLHYFRTTEDARIAFGWGGGRMALGTRRRPELDVDPDAVARTAATVRRFFPQLAGTPIDAAWGGPIDVSPTRLPQYRTTGRVAAGFGFTGNGVAPAYLGGQVLSALALDARDRFTRLPLVDPTVPRFPPEPLRFAGATAIRAAMVRADEDADAGRRSGAVVRAVAGVPRRLGMSLPR